MSDIEFLAIKEFGGKLKKNKGLKNGATGVLATLTASSGKDMYLARAKVIFYINSNADTEGFAQKVELQINSTVVETATVTFRGGKAESSMEAIPYEFKNIGHKVVATQVIKLQVQKLDTDFIVEGFVECFEEDTGDSPQVT